MKRTVRAATIAAISALALGASGCYYAAHQTLPADYYSKADIESKGLRIGEAFTGQASGMRLFHFMQTQPSASDVVAKAVSSKGAAGATNIEVSTVDAFNLFGILSVPYIYVKGDLVYRK